MYNVKNEHLLIAVLLYASFTLLSFDAEEGISKALQSSFLLNRAFASAHIC